MGAAGGCGALVVAAVLGVALAAAVTDAPAPAEPPLLAEVLFCQPAAPRRALAWALDDDQLFWFDFGAARWTPRSPRLPPWPPALEPPALVARDAALCWQLLGLLTRLATGELAEAKGVPVADVFPVAPLTLGEATTLVCRVENIFPPDVEVTWQLGGVPVTRGVTHTHYTPTGDLAFTRFSYLRVTPAAGDVVTCIVTRQEDNSTTVAFWVAPSPVATEELETALCGAAAALGALLGLLGVTMMVVTWRQDRG